ncbi:MAG: hypothetical protein RQ866_01630, partial [Bacteroidales bacterium]|nr:hypothetical protein [Bacteroidales bacterium]
MKALKKGTKVDHEKYGIGIITDVSLTSYEVLFERGGRLQFSKNRFEADILEEEPDDTSGNTDEAVKAQEILDALERLLDRGAALQE